MTRRELALRAVLHFAAFIAAVAQLALCVLRDLAVELADEVRASRNETNNRSRGNMDANRNTRLTDSVSMMRAANAKLAASVGDTTRLQAVLAEASFYAGNAAMPIRRTL